MTSRGELRSQLRHLLDDLGPRQTDVAASLGRAGVHGVQRDYERCALAAYLHAVLGADNRVRKVKVDLVEVHVSGPSRWRWRVSLPHPPGVRDFVRAFDAGLFPRLVYPSAVDEPTHR